MPELPEVEHGRRLAATVACGRTIDRVQIVPDEIIFAGVCPVKFRRALTGRKVLNVSRHGKQLWFELDQRPWPLFHFGMTGAFRTPGDQPLPLASSGKKTDISWPPRFTKIHLIFDDGGELVMTNSRRLGRILLRDDPLGEPPISKLGFDPLLNLPSACDFLKRLQRRKGVIKAVLMDQSFAAGVGNWIADEVLYQAKIDPRRRADMLSETEAKRVRNRLKLIVEKAVRVDADKKQLPRSWLFHNRWGKNSQAVTSKNEQIEHITVAGRTTAWVPQAQR